MIRVFKKALEDNNQELLKEFAKFIAIVVRNEMEDFHVGYLNDKQMAELNPLIRKGIYNALFAIANSNIETSAKEFIDWHLKMIPAYWEDPELVPQFKAIVEKLSNPQPIIFQSKFLNEQYDIGNLYFNPLTRCMEIKGSYDFKDVTGDKHKHRGKISSQLRKEGYAFVPSLQGYLKRA